MIRPTRTTQPHRRGARNPGASLAAMLKGRPATLPNPKDIERQALKQLTRPRRSRRRRRTV